MEKYDVIIIGTGVAGLYAALHFEQSVSVLLLTKKEAELSNSSLAQGGVAAVLDKVTDNYKLHIADTLIAGNYKNNLSAVEKLVTEGPNDVLALKDMGVDFDRDRFGRLLGTLEGGHSRNRIVHHKDSTGKAIVNKLLELVLQKPNVTLCDNTLVYALDKDDSGFCVSVLQNGENKQFLCNYCMLATGGIGRVYSYTTNSAIATGDGIAFAYLLGAKVQYLSRIQFHPTAFAKAKNRERFLISEAVRGEGGILLNCNGERFMDNYDPRAELAPRDVVSNAIIKESIKTNSQNFYLDISHKPAEFLKQRFPMIYEECLEQGVDITKEKIPIFPCQHYLMGGIKVDLDARTTVENLYAMGECSNTGVHGENRLASNSLLEALVFARRAAYDIASRIKNRAEKEEIGGFPQYNLSGNPLPPGIRTKIRQIIQDTFFVVLKQEKVQQSLAQIDEIINDLITGGYAITPDFIEARSLAIVAGIILTELSLNNK
ncbi:MAG: L-aspartate oxidase [Oscillospiraceae bacterium]|nr:L-aspartate oxidase [Oscillospiraceae bacterium]